MFIASPKSPSHKLPSAEITQKIIIKFNKNEREKKHLEMMQFLDADF